MHVTTSDTAQKRLGTLDDAITAIRSSILEGEFAPHQRLVEVDLCEQFGVSRAVVRNALLKLTSEGLVEHLPNRGARVRAISLDEAIEIVEARAALEALCARKAAERMTPEAREYLTELRAAIVDALESGDLAEYSMLHQRLDHYIRDLSAHHTSTQILERLQAQGARHQFRLSFRPGRAARSGPEHLEIIDALLAEDADAVEEATISHLKGVITAMRES
ncbi:GntR family transcriptional regulator [Leucobacter sp. G161]|nr:GntR family transcriptional regulator [Leucobacter sp. G161]